MCMFFIERIVITFNYQVMRRNMFAHIWAPAGRYSDKRNLLDTNGITFGKGKHFLTSFNWLFTTLAIILFFYQQSVSTFSCTPCVIHSQFAYTRIALHVRIAIYHIIGVADHVLLWSFACNTLPKYYKHFR